MPKSREKLLPILFLLSCLWVLPASAGLFTGEGPDDNVGLSVNQTEAPVFPAGLLLQGIHTGKVRLVISVDAEGRLTDKLVVAYTHKAFMNAVLEAVKTWTYEPMKVNRRPRASRVELMFIFKSDLNVIVQSGDMNVLQDLMGDQFEHKPYPLKDLDRIPTPVQVVSPPIPKGVLAAGEERVVTVEFYIDEEGKVRVPAVSREMADDPLSAVAVAAVEQWRFEPPLRRKKPVLVLAQQDFHFVAVAKAK